jgi:hypothetical protein
MPINLDIAPPFPAQNFTLTLNLGLGGGPNVDWRKF